MTDSPPLACSLRTDDLRRRLEEIARLGGEALISHTAENDARVLRFRSEPAIRRRLEAIVVAESECCVFLRLVLTEEGGELRLAISAPADAGAVADELARAFGKPR